MSYDCMETVCCQEKYIEGELLVRTDWELIGRARLKKKSVTASGDERSMAALHLG